MLLLAGIEAETAVVGRYWEHPLAGMVLETFPASQICGALFPRKWYSHPDVPWSNSEVCLKGQSWEPDGLSLGLWGFCVLCPLELAHNRRGSFQRGTSGLSLGSLNVYMYMCMCLQGGICVHVLGDNGSPEQGSYLRSLHKNF